MSNRKQTERKSLAWPIINLVFGILACFSLWVCMLTLLFEVRNFERIYGSFKVSGGLPTMTIIVINISHFAFACPLIFFAGVVAITAGLVVWVVIEFWLRHRFSFLVGLAIFLISALCIAVIVFSLFAPLANLIHVLPQGN